MSLAITLKTVGYAFESNTQHVALFDELTLTVDAGEFVSIMGPSGSGKSTLLSLMAGLEAPGTGVIEYLGSNGQPVPMPQAKKRMGFIFQQFHLLEELNALENIALPLLLKGDRQATEKAREWLDSVGLQHRATHRVSQLSGGEQQRVAIARALISQPDIIFADEPTGNLDEKTSMQIQALLLDCVRNCGASLVLVTHNPGLAECADRQYCLHQSGLELAS